MSARMSSGGVTRLHLPSQRMAPTSGTPSAYRSAQGSRSPALAARMLRVLQTPQHWRAGQGVSPACRGASSGSRCRTSVAFHPASPPDECLSEKEEGEEEREERCLLADAVRLATSRWCWQDGFRW